MSCECPRHDENVKDFVRRFPGADGRFGIVDVEPGEWLVNLEHRAVLTYDVKVQDNNILLRNQ